MPESIKPAALTEYPVVVVNPIQCGDQDAFGHVNNTVPIRHFVHSIALDQRRVLPVSTVQTGCYDIRDVALSVPTIVGRCGALDRLELDLWPKEVQGLRKSALVLRQTLETVLTRIGRR